MFSLMLTILGFRLVLQFKLWPFLSKQSFDSFLALANRCLTSLALYLKKCLEKMVFVGCIANTFDWQSLEQS